MKKKEISTNDNHTCSGKPRWRQDRKRKLQ